MFNAEYVFCLQCQLLYRWKGRSWDLIDGELEDDAKVILVNEPPE